MKKIQMKSSKKANHVSDHDLAMDMAEAWVHEHGNEDEDDRSGDLEKFFKTYENLTGGRQQNGVMDGLEAEFCGWERYTKGFGSRLLEQYGYEKGLGLGARAEGIVDPIKAFKFKHGCGLDYVNTAKVKNHVKQQQDLGLQLREAAQKVKDATGECGDEEWQGAFNLASSINVNEEGRVVTNMPGRVTNFEQWKQARAEEKKIDAAVDSYNALISGQGGQAEKKEPKKTKQEEMKEEALEEAQNQRLRVQFLQKRMKDAEKAFARNRVTDKNIAAQAKAIADECRAELGEAQQDSKAAEEKMHKQIKKAKKFKF